LLYLSYVPPFSRLSICLPHFVHSLSTSLYMSSFNLRIYNTKCLYIFIYIDQYHWETSQLYFVIFLCFAYIKIIQLQTKIFEKCPNFYVVFFLQINTLCNLNKIGDCDNSTVINIIIKCRTVELQWTTINIVTITIHSATRFIKLFKLFLTRL